MENIAIDNADTVDVKAEYLISAPEIIWQIGFFPVTNTMLTSLILTTIISLTVIILSSKISVVPGRFQAFFELFFDYVYLMTENMAKAKAPHFFPWIMTFVLFILIANLSGLLPGNSSIGLYKAIDGQQIFVPFIRSVNSDLNVTLALALISVTITHYYSIYFIGIKAYLSRWFSFKMFGVTLFVGLLELVSEFTKVISLSFRLYGNILAGKILLKTAKSFFPFILPLPFYFMEVMVSIVQAAVFMMLTLVFMVIQSKKHGE